MSTARHIRSARCVSGWPIGHADPEEDDDADAEDCPQLDDFDEFFAATQPADLDPCDIAAAAAEDRWIAERDRTASQ